MKKETKHNLHELLEMDIEKLYFYLTNRRYLDVYPRTTSFIIPNQIKEAIRLLSVIEERTMNEIYLEAITDYLKKELNHKNMIKEKNPKFLVLE